MATELSTRLTPAEGRRFAWTVGGAFVVLGAVALWRGAEVTGAALGGGGLFLALAGLVAPSALTSVYRAWMGLALLLSRVTTPVFLAVVYFLVLAPIGIAMRLVGYRPLARRKEGDSYFISRPAGPGRRSNLLRQF